ncbi:MAG TPA: phage major capsid protein [Gemmatimonadales bacterium]|nr:phage major capsid protein [Gemmatimonadales bacterium]
MALQTIVEADKYSRTQLLAGVVEEIVDASPMFAFLPFDTVLGNSLTYNRENTLGTAQFYDPADVWVESTPTVTQVVAKLKIVGGDADLDKFLALTRSNEQDLRAMVLSMKAKAVVRAIENELIYGDVDDVNAKGFDGLHEILGVVTGAQDVLAGSATTGGPGTFSKLDEMIDKVKPGPPDALIMSRRSRRQIKKLARSQGWDLALSQPSGLNRPINFYNDIPILVNDFITDTEDCVDGGFGGKTGDDTTSIFGVKFGAEGLHGIDGGQGLTVEDVGALETKDASRIRVKWYMSLVLMSTKALARLSGIDTQDWTN